MASLNECRSDSSMEDSVDLTAKRHYLRDRVDNIQERLKDLVTVYQECVDRMQGGFAADMKDIRKDISDLKAEMNRMLR